MKKQVKWIFPIMAVCLVALCVTTTLLVSQIQSYSKLVNYVGIVRGATQRLVKLEISGTKDDTLLVSLDEILNELQTGNGEIGLVKIKDNQYNKDLGQLQDMWLGMKQGIEDVRAGGNPDNLILLSEEYFKVANDTVFAAETYSNGQTSLLLVLVIVMVVVMVLSWALILISYVKRSQRLENDNKSLEEKVYTDALTGAPNLEKFQLEAQRLIEKHPTKGFAIFYTDIDNFKYYNDVFGTEYGDEVLVKYANFLRDDMGNCDTFCRVSADYFLVLRCYCDKYELVAKQENIDRLIAQYVLDTKDQHLFTLSCGICCSEDLSESLQIAAMIERANFARKVVKNQSIVHYSFYNESIRDKMLSEKAIENRMHSALENREFAVFMQPKVNLKTNKIACAEALVRWIAPDGKIIGPDEFIPIFEKNMFIVNLDKYVLEEVCRWIDLQRAQGIALVPISVNVSRMQLYDPEFVQTYAQIKDKYNVPKGIIEIEFTESMIFENLSMFLKIIAALKEAGFHCSLDDFGKGYSSLNLLRNLPVDVLKLDKLFFDEDEEIEKARTVIAGIIALVKKLNITIVAEGVERARQVDFLREIGCDLVQGYTFFRPMPIYEFEVLLLNDSVAVPKDAS